MTHRHKFLNFGARVGRALGVLAFVMPFGGCLPEVTIPDDAGADAGPSDGGEGCASQCDAADAFIPPNEPNGSPCVVSSDCVSGHCVDGVCCDNACMDTCSACSALKKGSGDDGTCGPIAANADPDDECLDGMCNGSGLCIANNGQTCTLAADCVSGHCVDGVCCDNACMDTCSACSALKKGSGDDGTCGPIAANADPDDECLDGMCNGAGACIPNNGQTCTLAADCASGYCVDNVCCDNACVGTCSACTAWKKGGGNDGVCGPIATNTDPDDECLDGVCNGAGACIASPVGGPCQTADQCATGFCVDGVCCLQSSCPPVDSCHVASCGFGTGTCINYPRVCPGGGTCSNGLCPGQCTGTFGFHGLPKLPIYYFASRLAMGDMDADGDQDLVVTSYQVVNPTGEVGSILNFLNDGTGAFVLGNGGGYALYNSGALIVADMNNDGYQDAIETGVEQNMPSLLVKFGTAAGLGGLAAQMKCGVPVNLKKVAAADLNNDGFLDVVGQRWATNGELYAVTNNGGTSIGTPTMLPNTGFADFDAADINGDGNADLVLANSTTGVVGVRFGNGNTTFGAKIDYSSVNGVNAVKFRDLNGDGLKDLVASNGTSTQIRLNAGNGAFAAAQTYSGGSADIGDSNGDGHLDILGSTTLFNNGNGTFTAQTMDYVPSAGAAIGDLDGDGLADLAQLEPGGAHLSFNLGNGSYLRPYFPQNLTVNNDGQIEPVDLNGDSLEDLALVSTSTNTVGVRINNGNGTYAPQIDYPTGPGPLAIAAADMNSDGFKDLVTSDNASVTILLNNGGGTLASGASYAVNEAAGHIVAADFNGDGYPDVARTTSTTTLKLMYNNGNGTLAPSVDGVSRPYQPAGLAAADLNKDGHIDIVSMSTWGLAEVYINNGSGGFTAPAEYLMVGYPTSRSLVLADLDGDGSLDLATASEDKNARYVAMMLNDGKGTFRYGSSLILNNNVNEFIYSVTAADIDGNGYNDLLVMLLGGKLRVYLNNGKASFAPDLRYSTNGDMFVPTDVDGDGISELLSITGALHTRACYP